MAALEGTIKTPLGAVPKKTALLIGGGIAIVAGVVYYRQKQANSSTSNGTIPDAEIDPATGYPYGSAEDAAALAQQAQYVSAGGGGGSSVSDSNTSSDTPTYASNNAEWVQMVLAYMQNAGVMSDVSALTAALGKYISGAYVNDTEVSLIQQAIAVKGQPPVAAANGYPPNLNRTPPGSGGTTTPPASTAKNAGSVQGKVTTTMVTTRKNGKAVYSAISTRFTGAANAVRYEVFLDGKHKEYVSGSPFTIWELSPGSRHTVGLRAIAANGSLGPITNSTLTTAK